MRHETPLQAVLSGEYELCLNTPSLAGDPAPFIRNACFPISPGRFTDTESIKITVEQAEEIKNHDCVILGYRGALFHYHTRRFPVNPDVVETGARLEAE